MKKEKNIYPKIILIMMGLAVCIYFNYFGIKNIRIYISNENSSYYNESQINILKNERTNLNKELDNEYIANNYSTKYYQIQSYITDINNQIDALAINDNENKLLVSGVAKIIFGDFALIICLLIGFENFKNNKKSKK